MVPPDEQNKTKKKKKRNFQPPLKIPYPVASTSASSPNKSLVVSTSGSQSNQATDPSNDIKRKSFSPGSHGKARMPGSVKKKVKVRRNIQTPYSVGIRPVIL